MESSGTDPTTPDRLNERKRRRFLEADTCVDPYEALLSSRDAIPDAVDVTTEAPRSYHDLLFDQGLPQILQEIVEKPVRGEDLARQRPLSVFSFGYRGGQGG